MTQYHQALMILLGVFWVLPGIAVERLPIPGIKGHDDRVLVVTTDYPWSAIGRIGHTLGGFCTGTLVGPRRVLTAAHCLWNRRTGNWLPACALHFLAGYQRGHYLAHSLVVSYEVAGGDESTPPDRPPGPDQDWAVLTLARDLAMVAGVLPTAPLDPQRLEDYRRQGGVFLQAGYSRDRPHILTRHDGCELTGFRNRGRLVLHECDATFGDSGSPILLRRDSRYHLVAVHIATENSRGKGIAVAGSGFHDRLKSLEPPPPLDRAFKACRAPGSIRKTVSLQRSFLAKAHHEMCR